MVMIDCGVAGDEQIDWAHLLDNIPDDLNFDFIEDSAAVDASDHGFEFDRSFSIDDVELYLLNDDSNQQGEKHYSALSDDFFSNVFLDSPHGSGSGSRYVSDPSKDFSPSPESVLVEGDDAEREEDKPHEKTGMQTSENNVVDVGYDDDPLEKKRKRQIRNRDAAVRSRERKKMHLRDLELKSKYYEAECKRLGTLLHCCLAENQSLRLSLHNSKASDASMTRQESAVLLLESLLLGSLLGFLGIMFLLILPSQFLSKLEACLLVKVDDEEWEKMSPRKAESEIHKILAFDSFIMGRGCKASRSRMKAKIIVSSSHSLLMNSWNPCVVTSLVDHTYPSSSAICRDFYY